MITGASSVVAVNMIEESRRFAAMKSFLWAIESREKKNPKMVKFILL